MVKSWSMRVKVRRRLVAPPWAVLASRVAAVLLALAVDALILLAYGVDPGYAYSEIIRGSLLSFYGLSEVVVKFIPLALCAYGLALAYRAGVWNIGAEGQLLMGALAATWVALFAPRPPTTLAIPLMYAAGFAAGALWALIPAVLKVTLSVNEVLTTFMLNLVAEKLLEYLVYGPWRGPREWGFPQTAPFPPYARLPTVPGTRIHYATLLLAACSAVIVYVVERLTVLGYEIRVVGDNVDAARYAGVRIWLVVLASMLISGGLAGLAGVGEVAGVQGRLRPRISPGYGYTAIVVAWLGGLNPISVTIASLLYSVLLVGGDMLQVTVGLPAAMVQVFNGSILLAVVGMEIAAKYRLVIER